MRRLSLSVRGFCTGSICLVLLFSENAAAQVQKRFGEVCAKLTGDAACKVCTKESDASWKCTSHTLWKEVPGTRVPTPREESSPSLARKTASGDDHTISSGPCDPDWSPKWDLIEDANVRAGMAKKGIIDQGIAQAGGLDRIIALTEQAETYDKEMLIEHQRARDSGGVWKLQQLMHWNEGMLDVLHCRQRQSSGASGRSINPGAGSPSDRSLRSDVDDSPTGSPSLSAPATQLVDRDLFAKSGKDPVDAGMEDLLKETDTSKSDDPANDGRDCSSALQYVAPGGALENDLDVATNQYEAQKEGLDLLEKTKSDLLNDSWWTRSKGPAIAAQIKYVCDEVEDWGAALYPEETAVSGTKDVLLATLSVAAKSIKAAYDNRQSVTSAVKAAKDAAARELAEIDLQKIAEQVKMGPPYATVKALRDHEEFIKTLNEAADYRDTVQEEVHKLDEQIQSAKAAVASTRDRQTALSALREDVVQACTQKPITITPP